MRTRWIIGTIICLTFCQGVLAQRTTAQQQTVARSQNTASVEQLSRQAYSLAQSAKSLDELTESLRACGQAMNMSPTPEQKNYIQKLAGWIYNKRGEALVKLAEQTAATDKERSAQYETAAAKDFDLSVKFDSGRWKSRFNRSVSKAMTGEYTTALEDLDFVVTQQPDHKNARFNRAEILLQVGKYETAIEDYAQVLKLDPQDSAAYAGRGIALAAIGRSDEAMADLNTVVRLDPKSSTAYIDRADLYTALGDWKRAAMDYRVAVEMDGQSARAYQNVAWLMATCPDEKHRNPALAVKAARRAIELQGQTYLGLDTYAAALASNGEFAKAAAAQQRAIQQAPQQERKLLETRLALYQQQRPFIESSSGDNNVRLASQIEDID